MKNIMLGFAALSGSMLSGAVSAHVSEHGDLGMLSSLAHLLTEHGYLLALSAVVIGVLVLMRKRLV